MSNKKWKPIEWEECPECGGAIEAYTEAPDDLVDDYDLARCVECGFKSRFSIYPGDGIMDDSTGMDHTGYDGIPPGWPEENGKYLPDAQAAWAGGDPPLQPGEFKRTCRWTMHPLRQDEFSAMCGMLIIVNRVEIGNVFIYCPYCGARIEVVE